MKGYNQACAALAVSALQDALANVDTEADVIIGIVFPDTGLTMILPYWDCDIDPAERIPHIIIEMADKLSQGYAIGAYVDKRNRTE